MHDGFAKTSVDNSRQQSAQRPPISESRYDVSSVSLELDGTSSESFLTGSTTTQVMATEQPSATSTNGESGMHYVMRDHAQALSPAAEDLAGSPSLDISQFFADFPETPCSSYLNPVAPEESVPRNSTDAIACCCLVDTLDIVQKLDDDAFQLRTLAFDHVLKLQKWLIFHCCKPLDCDKCSTLLQTYTVILIICDRVAEMFKCLSRRIKQPSPNSPEGDDHGQIGTPDMTTPSSSATFQRSEPLSGDASSAQLFDSLSGDAGIRTPCNPEMFSPEFRAQYSYDEQLHMIRVLAKIQVRNFNQLLVRISETQQTQQSQARFGKIMSLIRRLQDAGASMEESFKIMLQSLAPWTISQQSTSIISIYRKPNLSILVRQRGTPTGSMIKVGQHDAYLATAQNPRQSTGILYIPDVLGIWDNSKLLADEFAANGYTTLIIDLFKGDAIEVNRFNEVDLPDWVQNGRNGAGGHTPKEIDPIMEEALTYLKVELGFERIGAVGYCFGAKYLVRHYRNGIDVGYIAHPSFIEEDELAAITGPLSIAAAETDTIFPAEMRHRSEEILKENGNLYQINLFSAVVHGFAVRCDLSKKQERFAKEQAFIQAIAFFNAWPTAKYYEQTSVLLEVLD
ncbi:hypothetical protein G7Z17_g2766 [Cylindrodendrum hubeiense]|uniref:Dienelactone hydrolase domain-containing protein n=1 Tax=Cylindrodendrum hubeiense TaxID=595255 RepID=A0A9P5LIS9_9HYPO|nr:hypothetical protein G7Z17_g2766 [Cylindrodendrum hubeiense]